MSNVVTASVSGTAVQADTITGGIRHNHPYSAPLERPVPWQLTAIPDVFVGRVIELTELSAALGQASQAGATVVISAIAGAGRIGKTWLAPHWANAHMDRFPDG